MRTTWSTTGFPTALPRPPGWRRARRWLWRSLIVAAVAVVVALGVWLWIRFLMTEETRRHIFTQPTFAPEARVALVLGAGVYGDGRLSSAAAYRVDAAASLYRLGKVRKLLISGDNSSIWYDEVTPMKQRAIAQGVPDADVVLDYAGFRTYDSCYRAHAIFGVQQAIVVTQLFHLPRAVYTCQNLGIETAGLIAPSFDGESWFRARAREEPAKVLAWLEVNFLHPLPTYLGPKEEL